MGLQSGVNDSEFAMWRAVFAFSLVDHVLTVEEQKLLTDYMNSVPFSKPQMDTIQDDFKLPQDVQALYGRITEKKDKVKFCKLARTMAFSKGDIDLQEKVILQRVACFGSGADKDIFDSTRHFVQASHYDLYERAGLTGLMQNPNLYEARV